MPEDTEDLDTEDPDVEAPKAKKKRRSNVKEVDKRRKVQAYFKKIGLELSPEFLEIAAGLGAVGAFAIKMGMPPQVAVCLRVARHLYNLSPEKRLRIAKQVFDMVPALKQLSKGSKTVETIMGLTQAIIKNPAQGLRYVGEKVGEVFENSLGMLKKRDIDVGQIRQTVEKLKAGDIRELVENLQGTAQLNKIKETLTALPAFKKLKGSGLEKKLNQQVQKLLEPGGLGKLKTDVTTKLKIVDNLLKANDALGIVGQAASFDDALEHLKKWTDPAMIERLVQVNLKEVGGKTIAMAPDDLAELKRTAIRELKARSAGLESKTRAEVAKATDVAKGVAKNLSQERPRTKP